MTKSRNFLSLGRKGQQGRSTGNGRGGEESSEDTSPAKSRAQRLRGIKKKFLSFTNHHHQKGKLNRPKKKYIRKLLWKRKLINKKLLVKV